MSDVKPEIHFILRYSDRLRNVDTLKEHRAIDNKFKSVWMGKFGVGAAKEIVSLAKKQIEKGIPTYVYFQSNKSIKHYARIVDILGKGNVPKERELIPLYYRKEYCKLWFKITDIKPVSKNVFSTLRLFNNPYLRPNPQGMRGLIYVTYDKKNI